MNKKLIKFNHDSQSKDKVKKRNKKIYMNYASIVISIFSLIISLAVLVLESSIFEYNKLKDINQDKEYISISVSKTSYTYTVYYQKFTENSGLIPSIYEVYLSNNSNQGVSILSYEVNLIYHDNRKFFYEEIINNEEELQNSFPLLLGPNETRKIIFEINNIIPENVTGLISSKYNFGTNIVYNKLKDYLLEKNLDIYGNKYYYFDVGDNKLYSSEPENQNYPVYSLKIKTSKGNVFEENLSFIGN